MLVGGKKKKRRWDETDNQVGKRHGKRKQKHRPTKKEEMHKKKDKYSKKKANSLGQKLQVTTL